MANCAGERLGEQIADLTLGLGHQDVEPGWRNDVTCGVGLDRQKPDLRPVAMGEHELVAHPLEVGERPGGSEQVLALDRGRARLAAPDERVAAEGNDDAAHVRRSPAMSPVNRE